MIFLIEFACGILGAMLLGSYNKAGTGFLLGLILGPIGVVVALVMRSNARKKEEQQRHDEHMAAIERLKADKD